MIIIFFSNAWESKHIIVRLFLANDTSGATMFMKLKQVLEKISFTQNIVNYVKNEMFNLHTCATTFNSIISCGGLNLTSPFEGYCFEHAFSKVCQYAILDKKMACILHYALIKSIQSNIQKHINIILII